MSVGTRREGRKGKAGARGEQERGKRCNGGGQVPYQKPSIGKWLAPLVGLAFSFFLLLLHFRLNDLKELEWRRPVLSVFRRQVVRPFLLPSRRPRIPLPSFAENPLAAAERLSFRFPAAEENGRDRQTDRQTDRPTDRERAAAAAASGTVGWRVACGLQITP